MSSPITRQNALSVDWDQLVLDHSKNSRPLNMEKVRAYAVNILLGRQIQPIRVRRLKTRILAKRKYSVKVGFHRAEAFRLLCEEGLPLADFEGVFTVEQIQDRRGRRGNVEVRNERVYYTGPIEVDILHEKIPAAEERILRLSENKMRQEIDPISEAESYQEMMDEDGLTVPALALMFSVAEVTIRERLGLLKLPADVQDDLRHGRKSLSWALAHYNLETGKALQKRNGSEFRPRGKRALNAALKAVEDGAGQNHDLFKGMTSEQVEVAKKVLRWARGEEV